MTLRNRVLVVFALFYAIGAVLLVPGAPMTALSGCCSARRWTRGPCSSVRRPVVPLAWFAL
jgi:hypothetical protein